MLDIYEATKSYQHETILRIPSLKLGRGIYWVKGTNGSGKSTFLKMVAALIPFDGDIRLNGTSLHKEPVAYRRLVSWAEAEPLYPPFLRGRDLLRMYCEVRGADNREADQLAGLFHMNDYMDHAIGTYSSGMAKKLSLVLAFIGNTPLVVLDEPLITLDQESLQCLCALILGRNDRYQTSFLMSSHQEPDKKLMIAGKELLVQNQSISLL